MSGALEVVLVLAVIIPSVILHEVAHGVVALHYGDDTAARAGRLTLNPIKHVDLFGTLILPTMLALIGTGIFGYAKPVPVDRRNLRRPRDHGLLVSLAGPAVNVVLALVTGLVLRAVLDRQPQGLTQDSLLLRFLILFGVINVVLAAFNLLPIPPLDGSSLVERFLPARWLPGWYRLRRFSMPILFAIVLLAPGALSDVFDAALRVWATLL